MVARHCAYLPWLSHVLHAQIRHLPEYQGLHCDLCQCFCPWLRYMDVHLHCQSGLMALWAYCRTGYPWVYIILCMEKERNTDPMDR